MTDTAAERDRIAKLANQRTPLYAVVACAACGLFLLFQSLFRGTSDSATMTPAIGVMMFVTSFLLAERRLRIEPLLREVRNLRAELAQGEAPPKDGP